MRKGLPVTNIWLAFWIFNYCSVEPVVNVRVLVNFLLSKFVHWTRFTLDLYCYKLTYGGLFFISEPFLYSWNEQLKVQKRNSVFWKMVVYPYWPKTTLFCCMFWLNVFVNLSCLRFINWQIRFRCNYVHISVKLIGHLIVKSNRTCDLKKISIWGHVKVI